MNNALPMNKLRLMSIFVHIVEAGSISKAADKLDVSKSVISAALKQLEQELDTCLLKRTTRRQSLTPAGERFYSQCALMTKQAETAWQTATEFQQVPAGKLTVTAPHALMRAIVLPALTNVFNTYPSVHLNLISDDKHIDIMLQDIDLAVRVGASDDSNLKQRKVGKFHDILCQARGLTAQSNTSSYIAQYWQREPIMHQLSNEQEQQALEYKVTHRANTIFDVVTMLEMKLGVGLVPSFLLETNPKIEAVPNIAPSKENPIYMIHPYHSHTPLTVMMAIEAIEKRIKETIRN